MVFDEYTGQTHQFAPLASAAMAWLEELPRSAPELVAVIATDLGVAVDDVELHLAVDAALEQFRELDWIEVLTQS